MCKRMQILRRTLSSMAARRKNSGIDPFDIPSWTDTLKTLGVPHHFTNGNGVHLNGNGKVPSKPVGSMLKLELNEKISVWQGDITEIQTDAIVNAANKSLLGGGGVDGAIHAAAGPELRAECASLHGCLTGEAKMTKSYRLPCKYVIHTVGPIGQKPDKLRSCYWNCLELLKEHELRTCAFPCISTGVYGYPNEEACHMAVETVRKWLEMDDNSSLVDRIVFCVFLDLDVDLYEKILPEYFPPE
ncbi:ADP-ribose glycohydrolase MACROD1-like [Paramacrobiotus metropolitanus]|uniref:ADP-ribose glycohydrolase MACROD1-like n=1 Tax=Paramacrobiotus metropolitanus TaxID=2943436 RepID=UPI002445E090|nr:ADP-ribose glycohydrolase MACROD1-like [Paramacrobiotus metropolitanus]